MKYTLDQIRQAGKEGEVNHLDVEHIIDLLKEQSNVDGIEADRQDKEIERLKELVQLSHRVILGEQSEDEYDPAAYGRWYDAYQQFKLFKSHKVETPEQDELWDELREDIYRHRKTFKECSSKFTLIKK